MVRHMHCHMSYSISILPIRLPANVHMYSRRTSPQRPFEHIWMIDLLRVVHYAEVHHDSGTNLRWERCFLTACLASGSPFLNAKHDTMSQIDIPVSIHVMPRFSVEFPDDSYFWEAYWGCFSEREVSAAAGIKLHFPVGNLDQNSAAILSVWHCGTTL